MQQPITVSCPITLTKHVRESKGYYKPTRMMMLILKILTNLKCGRLEVILPDGKRLLFAGDQDGPEALLRVHNDRMARRFLIGGKLGFCESYLDGDWSSPDISTFFELVLRNAAIMKKTLLGKRWVRALSYCAHVLQPNSKRGSKKNIYKHYDIGNDFFKSWLDKTMTYSSALFLDDTMSLEDAQNAKYQEMVDRLELTADHHVLEIGCGWGGFSEYAAKTTGCKITAVTVSQAQYDYAVARMKKAGLQDKVEIRLQDYRDIQGQFDRIASIEMFEAVGEQYWPVFFNKINELLKSGGRSVLQIITIHNDDFPTYRKSADYIQRYIFPGGMLPSLDVLKIKIQDAGLKVGDHLSFGQDYAKTLGLWNNAFQKSWPNLTGQAFDTRFKRLWEQYLCYCEAGFRVGNIDVIQINIDKPGAE